MSQPATAAKPHVAIIGAGIIGLSCALELSRRGACVDIYDKSEPGRGASWAAAGMLAPGFEAAGEAGAHPRLYDLCMESARLWPAFADSLEQEAGLRPGYAPGPSIAVSMDACGAARLDALAAAIAQRGDRAERLSAAEARRIEPMLAPDLTGAVLIESDGQADNRAVVLALLSALQRRGVAVRRQAVEADVLQVDAILLCAGHQDASVAPVKGQMAALAPLDGAPARVVRLGDVYVAPKADRIVVGATVEPGRSDTAIDPAAIDALIRQAARALPALAQADILERWAGVRPATPDKAPLLGRRGGAFVATGHHRNGVLLAPVTARIMADLVLDGRTSDLAAAFSPARFQGAAA